MQRFSRELVIVAISALSTSTPKVNEVGSKLGAYARLINADFATWCQAVIYFTQLTGLRSAARESASQLGYVSHLPVAHGDITYLAWPEPVVVESDYDPQISRLFDGSGRESRQSNTVAQVSGRGILLRSPLANSGLASGQNIELIYLRFKPGFIDLSELQSLDPNSCLMLNEKVRQFFEGSRYFPDHAFAVQETEKLFEGVKSVVTTGRRSKRLRILPQIDKRAERVVTYIEKNHQSPYSVKALTDVALTSERNLYLLMKKYTGLTPYQYYIKARLVQVRSELIARASEDVSIAWHATNRGFTHLGRFSAQYRELFGELPSETLAAKKTLRQYAAEQGPSDSTQAERASTSHGKP